MIESTSGAHTDQNQIVTDRASSRDEAQGEAKEWFDEGDTTEKVSQEQ